MTFDIAQGKWLDFVMRCDAWINFDNPPTKEEAKEEIIKMFPESIKEIKRLLAEDINKADEIERLNLIEHNLRNEIGRLQPLVEKYAKKTMHQEFVIVDLIAKKRQLRSVIEKARNELALPNPAIVDTIWMQKNQDAIGITLWDFLNNALENDKEITYPKT